MTKFPSGGSRPLASEADFIGPTVESTSRMTLSPQADKSGGTGEGRPHLPIETRDAPQVSDGAQDHESNLSYELEINTSLKRELKEHKSKIRSYSLTIKELQSQIDRTIAELRAYEDQIDDLRADYVELKASRSAELKKAILSVQSQLSRTLEDFSHQQLWLAALCRTPERLEDLKRAFNGDEYLSNNHDIAEAFYLGRIASPFEHWMACGAAEGRRATFKYGPGKE